MQDNKSRYLHNQAVRRANEVRQRRATVENPQWAMSRPAEWYKDRENLASIKDTLVNQQGNRDFWTTDQDESRNAYQMLMNQMKGGDRGARMMDLRGLPPATQADPNRYRRGRTMFQDPSKSQGFLGDVGSLLSGNNKAAVYADEYNPFPKAGFGADWYKDQFPIASGLGSLMEGAENFIPGATWAKQFLPKSNRVPLERDLSWVPEGLGEYDKAPMMEFEDEIEIEEPGIGQEDFPFLDMINQNPRADSRIEKYIRYPEAYPEYAHLYPGLRNKSAFPGGYGDEFFTEELIDLPPETFEESTNEIFNEEVFNKVYELIHPTGQTAAEMPEHFDQFESPWDMFLKLKEATQEDGWSDQELLDLLVEKGYLNDTTLEE